MPAPILHIDVRATHWPTLPEGAQIPLCPCDGDQPHDHYTTDATKVTCQACRDAPPSESKRITRAIVLDDGPVECQVFDRSRLRAGNRITGRAVIEEPASSTLLRAGDVASVSEWGHLLIELREDE